MFFGFQKKPDCLSISGDTVVEFNDVNSDDGIADIPYGITTIGDEAFARQSVYEVHFPSTLTRIESAAFYDTWHLSSVVIPSSVNYIGNGAFEDCRDLETAYISSAPSYLGTAIFLGCGNLRQVQLPYGIKEIPQSMFHNCYKLTSIEIPSSVESIGGFAFTDCSSLRKIVIPPSVISIGAKHLFSGCNSLESIELSRGFDYIIDQFELPSRCRIIYY